MKEKNDYLDKIIDKSKSFEDQIESLEKIENLDEDYFINDFDVKELESKTLHACQILLTKSYLNKYLVIHL